MTIPSKLYHWTEALNVESIRAQGLHTSLGGYINQHDDEPGVNLSTCSLVTEWNSDIFYLARPVRIEIDTTQLDARLFGPDMNSVYDEGCVGNMADDDLDAQDHANQTAEISLYYTGNCRYLAAIPPSALSAFDAFVAPRDWKMQDTEAELYEPSAPTSLLA